MTGEAESRHGSWTTSEGLQGVAYFLFGVNEAFKQKYLGDAFTVVVCVHYGVGQSCSSHCAALLNGI